MQTAPIPENESERMASLRKLQILDTPPEERFDRITRLATKVFSVPISTITLVDSNREWYKSVCGLDEKEGDRAVSFCGHAMLEDEILIIPDAKKDPRFSDNPMVVGEPFIRFYAGVPLFSADGARIGTFCVKGHEPREITEEEKDILKGLAKWTELEINTHNLSVALDQVKKSVTEVDNFFQISPDIMGIANTDGFWKRCNPAFIKLLGYSGDELFKSPFLNFIHPDDIEATQNEVAKLGGGAKTINFLNRYRKVDGSYAVIQWNAIPFGTDIYATGRDISEMKEREMQSNIQQERLELLATRFTFATKSAKIGIWEWDIINNRLTWDDQMYALYGIKREQFGGAYDAWQAGLHPDDKKSGDNAIQQALAGEKEFDITFRVIWSDKSVHYIKAYGAVEKDEKGVPQRMVGVNWDVTIDKIAEAKLKQFEAVIRDTDYAVISKTLDGTVTGWNAGAQKLYGYTPEEMIGKSINAIVPAEHDDLKKLLQKVSADERIPSYATMRKRKDGSLVDVSLVISPIHADDGSIVGASVVARDITKEKMIDKEKTEFVSLASHQLRTPLTGIKWATELLLKKREMLPREMQEYIDRIHESEERMVSLVNGLLNTSRLDSGTLIVAPKLASITALLAAYLRDFSLVTEKKKITVVSHLPSKDISMQIDQEVFGVIIENLLSNALKYTPEHGTVQLDLIQERGKVRLSITDSGIGIPKNQQSKIFEKFFRADNAKALPVEGTGLGLHLTKAMVDMAGGELSFTSKEGKGTTFTVSFPEEGMSEKAGIKKLEIAQKSHYE